MGGGGCRPSRLAHKHLSRFTFSQATVIQNTIVTHIRRVNNQNQWFLPSAHKRIPHVAKQRQAQLCAQTSSSKPPVQMRALVPGCIQSKSTPRGHNPEVLHHSCIPIPAKKQPNAASIQPASIHLRRPHTQSMQQATLQIPGCRHCQMREKHYGPLIVCSATACSRALSSQSFLYLRKLTIPRLQIRQRPATSRFEKFKRWPSAIRFSRASEACARSSVQSHGLGWLRQSRAVDAKRNPRGTRH